MKNGKTTLAGIGAILVAVGAALKALFDNDPATSFDITTTVTALSAGIGLILAKDASSADAPKVEEKK